MALEKDKLMNLADGKVLYDDLRERVEGKYTKPSGGIPASDLAAGVIPDISGKADEPTGTKSAGKVYGLDSNLNPVWTEQGGSGTVTDVQVNGVSVLDGQGVANVPVGSTSNYGALKVGSGFVVSNGIFHIFRSYLEHIKAGTEQFRPIVPENQHMSAFYGLAKAAGDATQAVSSNPVGTYTDDAKTAIKTMLGISDPLVTDVQVNGTSIVGQGGIAILPKAGQSVYGLAIGNRLYGIDINNGVLTINRATDNGVKEGANNTEGKNRPITPLIQHASVFYGLAKAAGADMASIQSTTIGVYPETQKSAISQMLNAPVSVTGTTPSITALAGVRYICGEVSTLDITLPASGCIDVTFQSGATATVLTITPPTGVTVKWANGFDPTSLDANTTYEINIMDGLGVAVSWT